MELIDSQQLAYLIENLTTSGSQELDKANLKKLKSICKKSDEHVHHVYHLLITQLERDHSEIRLAVLALIDELFQRSHIFRELLLDNFNDFIELTAETNFDMPLPDPRSAAKKLIRKAVQCVEAWNNKFGPAYRKLSLGYEYLKGTKKVQLVHADEVQTEIQRNAQEERRRRRDLVNTKRLDKAMKDIDIYSPDIENCVAEMESCFMMLVPKLDDENEGIDEDDVPDDVDSGLGTSNVMHGSGLISLDYSIQLDLSQDVLNTITVKKSMNTTDLIDNLKDREKMLKNLYLPKIKRWMASLGACGAPGDTLKRIIDLKRLVSKTLEKSQELLVVSSTTTDEQDNIDAKHSSDEDEDSDSDNSSDDDFIEVLSKPVVVFRENNSASTSGSSKNKQHFLNPNNNDAAASKDTNIWKPIRNDDNVADPASYMRALKVQKEILKSKTKDDKPKAAKLKKLHPKKSSKSSDGIEKIEFPNAPVVSFGPDLLEWDPTMKQELKETLSMGSAKELDIGHRSICKFTLFRALSGNPKPGIGFRIQNSIRDEFKSPLLFIAISILSVGSIEQ